MDGNGGTHVARIRRRELKFMIDLNHLRLMLSRPCNQYLLITTYIPAARKGTRTARNALPADSSLLRPRGIQHQLNFHRRSFSIN